MKISIFGLGYVGCVSAGCLANNGHKVIGVDVNQTKVELINNGFPSIIESQVDELISKAVKNKLLTATLNSQSAVNETDVSIICVGTPNSNTGHLNLDYIFETARNIGQGIKSKSGFHTIVIRSTVSPGTNKNVSEFNINFIR